jgi:hypothetical protein
MSGKKQLISNYFLAKPKKISNPKEGEPLLPPTSGDAKDDTVEESDLGEHKVDTNKEADDAQGAETFPIITPNQPRNFPFPKREFGKQKRSFQPSWFKEYPWLHYNEKSDSAFCYVCFNQNEKGNLRTARNMEQAFISNGYSNWKKALSRFKEHQVSECHKVAVDYERVIPKTCGNIIDMTDKTATKTREQNRHCLARILESLKYLARQGLAFRGDDDKESNFIQLLNLLAKDDNILAEWLKCGATGTGAKYTSHDTQNELICLMATNTIRELVSQIRNNYYSLICDEYTDISNKEQLTICLRWIDEQLEAHEDFIGFYAIPNIKADTITCAIKDALIRLQLSLNDCRGQCYDGASNMLGKKSGTAQQILAVQPKAFVTHCHAHSLSLGVKSAVKDCKLISDTMSTAKELVTLIKYSPKRETILGRVKDNIEQDDEGSEEEMAAGILKLCPTRWTVTAACYERILANYASLLKAWEVSLEGQLEPDVRARILGCDAQMKTFNFFFGLHLSKRLFAHTDNLSKTLQSSSMSAAAGHHLANLMVKTLESIRNEESFDGFYDVVLIKVKQYPAVAEPTLPRKRRAPARYETGNAEPVYPPTARDHYRKVYFEAVDHLISSVKERFDQPAFKVYATLETLLLRAAKGEDISNSKEMEDLKLTFSADVNVNTLVAQLCTFGLLVKGNEFQCFPDILTAVKNLHPHERQLIDNVITLCKLIHVNPATSATGERSFSTARRVKTWQRSTMLQSRFSHLAILNTHKDRLDNLCLVSVANAFVSLNENRQRNFGTFTIADFQR